MTMPINAAGERLLKRSEGLVLHAYPDPRSPLGQALQRLRLWSKYLKKPIPRAQMPADIRELDGAPWTMGYGDTLDVQEGDTITRAEAEARLVLRMERDFLTPMRRAWDVAIVCSLLLLIPTWLYTWSDRVGWRVVAAFVICAFLAWWRSSRAKAKIPPSSHAE